MERFFVPWTLLVFTPVYHMGKVLTLSVGFAIVFMVDFAKKNVGKFWKETSDLVKVWSRIFESRYRAI